MAEDAPGARMARLERPTSGMPTRLAVVADPHVATEAAGSSKLFEYTEDHFRAAIEDIRSRDVDAVVSVGDLTKDGEPWNYEAVDEAIDDLVEPFLSVPGNHDVPKERDEHDTPSVDWFADRYATGEFPFVEEIGGIQLVGLNTAGTREFLYESHAGGITDEDLEWLRDTLPGLETPVVVSHYNLPDMSAQLEDHRDAVEPEMAMPPFMDDPDPLVDVLSDHDVPLVLSGHLHLPSFARTDGVPEVMAPTTCSFPQAYLVLDIDENGTDVRFVPVADREGLRYARDRRSHDSITARGLTSIASVRLAEFPLVDERRETTSSDGA